MRGTDAHGVSTVNLRAKLEFDLFWIDFCGGRPIVTKITVLIEQARNFVFRSDRPPAVVDALAGQCKVEAKIELWMGFGVIGNLREPRARHHDAGRVDETGVESLDRCIVQRMSHANVIGVNNQELGIPGIAELFRKRIAVDLRTRIREHARKNEKEQDGHTVSIHWPASFSRYRTSQQIQ